ncbi:excalibur calcium-binding domain-containing protein [Kribbella monticola]|uniref:excalibur calcium-binding domain-containing protein n=1 Tax=Kribbella monticola TaxID=2185285 RepID=UPI001E466F50|nr:excalibur calcium-binding domain-containing protein [Kribbella monticola]
MRHFNAPPEWPEPPTARWRPPKRWQPDESWPAAPMDWPFWVDSDGRRVRGPRGRYGGPSYLPIFASTGLVLLVGALVSFILFGSLDGNTAPTRVADSPSILDTALPPLPTVPLPTPEEITSDPMPPETPKPTPKPLFATISPAPTTKTPSTAPTPPPPTTRTPTPTPAGAPVFYKNCPAVRRAGLLVLLRGMPGYSLRLDPDGDGIACERRG